jgi:hypothetical protein
MGGNAFGQMQLKAANIFRTCHVWRTTEKHRELLDRAALRRYRVHSAVAHNEILAVWLLISPGALSTLI